jgi:hypothetical protein
LLNPLNFCWRKRLACALLAATNIKPVIATLYEHWLDKLLDVNTFTGTTCAAHAVSETLAPRSSFSMRYIAVTHCRKGNLAPSGGWKQPLKSNILSN